MTATRLGIENKAGSGEIKNLTDLCYEVLEPTRAKFDKPITITSGYRSKNYAKLLVAKKLHNTQRVKPVILKYLVLVIYK